MKNLLIYLTCFLLPVLTKAQGFPEKPNRLVNDYTQTLSSEQLAALEQKLVAFNDSTSTQISVVLINSLEGYDVADYAVRLAEKWGIGRKQKDNGVLLLAAVNDRRVTIQVGYGLEGAITDALSRRIIEKVIKPSFTQGNYYKGIDEATNSLMKLSSGEYMADEAVQDNGKRIPRWPLLLALIIFVLLARSRKRQQNIGSRTGGGIPAWPFLMGSGRGSWGDFSSGSGGFGGFGGFGGGGFGGGGASGSW